MRANCLGEEIMKPSRQVITLITLLLFVIAGLLIESLGHAHRLSTQDPERSFDVERYPNEPLELVELKIRGASVRSLVRSKSKDKISKWGLDNVKFKEKDDWLRNVKIRLRNVSQQPITSVDANLYLKHSELRILFRIFLKQSVSGDLKEQPLLPGHEIDLEVNDASYDETMTTMRESGIDPNTLPISLSVDSAMFLDNTQWHRGNLLRRDPYSPNKWDPIDKPTPGQTSSNNRTGFLMVGFKKDSLPAPDLRICQAEKGGYIGYPCTGDSPNCWRIVEWGIGAAGFRFCCARSL